ncbi:hypothetical protein [Enterovibrio norvegicus]|uniref:hypothetical protein n=1 Tax=Enterovibrio norvegicus TaxID=188144 RepID=UPI000C816C52|nr:hypothetical protein [Enterovibrio norvegicus]PML77272.1 hypothetical protein BCT69_19695 [Enterovibrio norvegicus]
MKNNVKAIASLVALASLSSVNAYADCFGNVYSINGGRGEVGLLLDIQESDRLTGYTNPGSRALLESRALFSSAAMAYDPNTNRTYYANVIAPLSYHIDGVENVVSADELKSLSLHLSKGTSSQLAYYDHTTKEHKIVGDIPFTYRMAYDPESEMLVASGPIDIFSINPLDAAVTQLSQFDTGVRFSGFSSWGDFIYVEGELLYITNNRTFALNKNTGAVSLKAFHNIDFVTSATLDQNGQVLVATKNQNVTSNVNSTWLWRLNVDTGEIVQAGLFPARINALSTNTQETHTCYDTTIFPSELVVVDSVSGDTVIEGQAGQLLVSFNSQNRVARDITLALADGSASGNSDFSRTVKVTYNDGTSTTATLSASGTQVPVPAGITSLTVEVRTIDDSVDEETETASFSAWFKEDKSDLKSATLTITDNDEPIVPNICANNDLVQVRTNGAYVFVNCSNGRLGGPSISAQNISKRVSWSTNSYGSGSQSEWNTQIGVTEAGDLRSMSYSGSGSNNSNVCSNGGTSGTRINTTINGSITFNGQGQPVCRITLNETFCNGSGGLRYQNSSSNTCEFR